MGLWIGLLDRAPAQRAWGNLTFPQARFISRLQSTGTVSELVSCRHRRGWRCVDSRRPRGRRRSLRRGAAGYRAGSLRHGARRAVGLRLKDQIDRPRYPTDNLEHRLIVGTLLRALPGIDRQCVLECYDRQLSSGVGLRAADVCNVPFVDAAHRRLSASRHLANVAAAFLA